MEDYKTIIDKLKAAFKDPEVKKNVLDSDWYEKNIKSGLDSTGFCFYATETLYRLTGRQG